MDSTLHCNDLKCRALVTDRAVVTTCSHIFCLPCADRLELTAPKDGQRKCPACSTFLVNPDDAVVASLNPTEDYKTSILSGLSPSVIIECAGRGLSFWAYQMAQEITYQEYLARNLAERYSQLSSQMDGVMRGANDENNKLHAKLEGMHAQHAALLEKYDALDAKFRQRNDMYQKTSKMYNKLKQQQLAAGMELAVEHNADNFLSANTHQCDSQQQGAGVRIPRSISNGSTRSDERRRRAANTGTGYSQAQTYIAQGSRRGLGSSHSAAVPLSSQNRQRLPEPLYGRFNVGVQQSASMGEENLRRATPLVGGISSKFGMSAGLRAGRQPHQSFAPPGSGAGYVRSGKPGVFGIAPIP